MEVFLLKPHGMKTIIKKHPLAIRWFHWLNFPLLSIMIWSGLLIYWANDVYRIGFGDFTLLKFFPNSFYEATNLPFRLGEGMAFHFVFMWAFTLNGLLYVLFTIISGEWRLLLPNKHSIKEALQVVKYDLRLSKEKPPQQKYNGAQRIAYTMIVIMGVGSVLSGIGIYKPIQFPLLCSIFGGYEMARIIHFVLTIGYCFFFIIHLLQVMKAGWNNFRSMVTGFEILKNKK
jgi:thiosulfate reductase cytochrome b subunit